MNRRWAIISLILSASICITIVRGANDTYSQKDFEMRNLEPFVTRPAFCADLEYRKLPNATIIITVLNEESYLLEANIKSILAKTPPELLDSIIVVDDFSEFIAVSPTLLRYPKVQIVRNDRPRGVAGARMVGAALGKGEVLVFLDAQMEVTERWLEPLLAYVATHPFSAASAVIDEIHDKDGSYTSFTDIPIVTVVPEKLAFKWTHAIPKPGYLLYSPVLLGSAFAIKRSWFDEGGKYDPGNEVWGIENIELSVRVWTCGGEVVFMPCSRLGHYFRNTRRFKSPRFGNTDFVYRNGIRFAEVWMDDYAQDYYMSLPWSYERILKIRSEPDLVDRKLIRQKMKCKNFDWYVNTILKGITELYNLN